MSEFNLKIVAPRGLVCEEQVSSVIVPTVEGDIGILPDHAKYSGMLGVGILEYQTTNNNQTKKVVVAEGFCNFEDGTLVILADEVALPADVAGPNFFTDEKSTNATLSGTSGFNPEWDLLNSRSKKYQAARKLLLDA